MLEAMMDYYDVSRQEAEFMLQGTMDRFDENARVHPAMQWQALESLYRGIPHVRGVAGLWWDYFEKGGVRA